MSRRRLRQRFRRSKSSSRRPRPAKRTSARLPPSGFSSRAGSTRSTIPGAVKVSYPRPRALRLPAFKTTYDAGHAGAHVTFRRIARSGRGARGGGGYAEVVRRRGGGAVDTDIYGRRLVRGQRPLPRYGMIRKARDLRGPASRLPQWRSPRRQGRQRQIRDNPANPFGRIGRSVSATGTCRTFPMRSTQLRRRSGCVGRQLQAKPFAALESWVRRSDELRPG